MVYRRPGGKGWTFQARTRSGWYPMTARTPSKALAAKIEGMWETLATEYRAWDLLEPVLAAPRGKRWGRLARLYDFWAETKHRVSEVRRRTQDVPLEPILADYLPIHAQRGGKAHHAHVSHHLRLLLPEGAATLASEADQAWLTARLYAYQGGPNTLRRVHSSWSGFFDYCTKVRGLFLRNPMEDVEPPAERKPPICFYELDTVSRIIGAQPTEDRRVLFTLLYGTGIEISTALRLTRADVALGTREIRAAGTKAHTRHRVAIVADWAWPAIEAHVRSLLPTARLFPETMRSDEASHWHKKTVVDLGLRPQATMHGARHHWAVMRLRAGTPVAVVQNQLGHSTPMLTLTTYGPFIPTGADRAYWETQTTAHEERRRGVK